MITKEDAQKFIREEEKKINAALKKVQSPKRKAIRITHQFNRGDDILGRYRYNQLENGVVVARVVIGEGSNGKAKIVQQWRVTPQPNG